MIDGKLCLRSDLLPFGGEKLVDIIFLGAFAASQLPSNTPVCVCVFTSHICTCDGIEQFCVGELIRKKNPP